MNSITDLIWKMECKGFEDVSIHFYINYIWLLTPGIYLVGIVDNLISCEYRDRLAQAHIEIDFTNFKKNDYGKA